jgi:hypothetical protein
VVQALGQDAEWTLSDLAEHIAANENDCTLHELDRAERKRVYVSLYQTHLDRLENAGVIELTDKQISAQATVVTAYRRILACAREQAVKTDDRDDRGVIASMLGGIRG